MRKSIMLIWFRSGIFLVALYACMTGLFSYPTEHHFATKAGENKTEPLSRNVILMVVDALRSDMISGSQYRNRWPHLNAAIENGYVDCWTSMLASPTVTSPRIKAIATGRIPEFIDILYNLGSKAVKQTSWVRQSREHGKRLELYGDSTWLRIFPGDFGRSDGTTSFFVNDFFEVDSNVTRHLIDRVAAHNEWDLMVLHYLGVDHVGHVQGPQGQSMPLKLLEMDNVVEQLISGMKSTGKDDWIIILTGDHGMSDKGSHGGGSFSEISTTLVLISPQFKKAPNSQACSVIDGRFEARSDQTDIATLIGLLMGVGIPAGSIGVPPFRAMQAFWSEPLSRYRAFEQLLRHLRDLAGCGKGSTSDCSSNALIPNEILKLNQMYEEVSAIVTLCHDASPASSPSICARMYTDMEAMTTRVMNLMTTFQQRKLLHTNSCTNVNLAGCACLVMAAISASFIWAGVREVFSCSRWHLGTSQANIYWLMLHRLGAFSLSTLLIHLLSLLSSSLIEEEHQTWYYIAASCLFLFLVVLAISEQGGSARLRAQEVASVLGILFLDRFLLKLLNQTGDKWIGLPDLTDWLGKHHVWFWIAQLSSWLLIFLCRTVLAIPTDRFRTHHRGTLFTLTLVILSQLAYRIIEQAADSDRAHMWAPTLLPARFAYLCLAVDFLTCYRLLNKQATWSCGLGGASHSLHDSPVLTSITGQPAMSPVHSFAFLVVLLGRPVGVLLWAGVVLKELLLVRIFHQQFVSLAGKSMLAKQARIKMTYFIVILYWMEGWVTFFQQGNANKFSSIDMATGYVGLSQHSHILSTLLVASFTYAGPIFWLLSLFYRYCVCWTVDIQSQVARVDMAELWIGLLTAVTTVSGVICLFMNSHLFIWTVFAPKLFFMAVLCVFSIPLIIFML